MSTRTKQLVKSYEIKNFSIRKTVTISVKSRKRG